MGTNNVIPRIRCNRQVPCSNCVTSSIPCHAVGHSKSAGTKRTVSDRPLPPAPTKTTTILN
ncbi:fungal zn(2)-Cys(6) binuclear cluster domain-containing protein [Purpureocillium lilacinum]|uniref:Fungal zn(2)-Cys(6) binuclear cluster domain-containing protein n=1 Tax=Purpureocillium lilacinum TaxID=33203 RepID=A0A179GI41_PURLI|nr:fungal zn(2)-Cys(6) binuclear cluster domain-containing protein [Purpureocillium lilacinum]OAQ63934.1 fungal zn(2)-Cys(6) binuclear cluster domain-containing protein [Purpureocillium lilacinum]OAQ77003.1 fungal zn(2)-Cys(6) binuclear cluster domain-containing protein [Purpureocillium lilacinum]